MLNPALSEAVTQQQQQRRRPLFNYGHRVRIRKSLSLTFRFSGDSPHVCLRPCRRARVHVCVSVQSQRITADKDVWLPVILCSRFSRRSLSLAPSLFTIQDTHSPHVHVEQRWQKRHTNTHSTARHRTDTHTQTFHALADAYYAAIVLPL